jgi:purine nucleosidase
MGKKLVYIDTDISLGTPGAEIDDGAALITLLRSQSAQVIGCGSVHGNVPVEDASQNLLRLLSLLGKENIRVGIGASRPLLEDKSWFKDWQAGYGLTPPWPIAHSQPTAVDLLIQLARSASKSITILAIGPLTNIALALQKAADIGKKVEQIILMGGSFGGQNPQAEFNIHCDPEAAQMILSSGLPVRILGLEGTRQVFFSHQDFASLSDSDPAVRLLKQQATGWIGRVEKAGWEKDGCALHDAVAAAAIVHPEYFQFRVLSVSVELSANSQRGLTRFEELNVGADSHPAEVAVHVDAARCKAWILSSLLSTPG